MSFTTLFSNSGAAYTTTSGASVYSMGAGTAYHCNQGYDPNGLQELLKTLREYDLLRLILEKRGGNMKLVTAITQLLDAKVHVSGPYGRQEVSLNRPDALRSALGMVGQTDVKFNIRRLEHGLPAYYIARIHRDWWGIYSLIVEDVHLSPGYPLLDPRFARIMTVGRERYYLRLSLFREQVAAMFTGNEKEIRTQADALLYDLGRCVFQGAWHTDQRFAFVFANVFNLPQLRNAIELVYLSLSCDLSALRRFLTPAMQQFFDDCYGNPGISQLLHQLETMTGTEMNEISQRGLEAYQQLANAMNNALAEEIRWTSSWQGAMPLWKIVVANVNRLDTVKKQLVIDHAIDSVIMTLEESATECAKMILGKDTLNEELPGKEL